jgi:hypothetical protein
MKNIQALAIAQIVLTDKLVIPITDGTIGFQANLKILTTRTKDDEKGNVEVDIEVASFENVYENDIKIGGDLFSKSLFHAKYHQDGGKCIFETMNEKAQEWIKKNINIEELEDQFTEHESLFFQDFHEQFYPYRKTAK